MLPLWRPLLWGVFLASCVRSTNPTHHSASADKSLSQLHLYRCERNVKHTFVIWRYISAQHNISSLHYFSNYHQNPSVFFLHHGRFRVCVRNITGDAHTVTLRLHIAAFSLMSTMHCPSCGATQCHKRKASQRLSRKTCKLMAYMALCQWFVLNKLQVGSLAFGLKNCLAKAEVSKWRHHTSDFAWIL